MSQNLQKRPKKLLDRAREAICSKHPLGNTTQFARKGTETRRVCQTPRVFQLSKLQPPNLPEPWLKGNKVSEQTQIFTEA